MQPGSFDPFATASMMAFRGQSAWSLGGIFVWSSNGVHHALRQIHHAGCTPACTAPPPLSAAAPTCAFDARTTCARDTHTVCASDIRDVDSTTS